MRNVLIALVLGLSACCGTDHETTSASSSSGGNTCEVCPTPGTYGTCDFGATLAVCDVGGGVCMGQCKLPEGWLTHDCPSTCTTGNCAVASDKTVTCLGN